jgi:hypothetical protein
LQRRDPQKRPRWHGRSKQRRRQTWCPVPVATHFRAAEEKKLAGGMNRRSCDQTDWGRSVNMTGCGRDWRPHHAVRYGGSVRDATDSSKMQHMSRTVAKRREMTRTSPNSSPFATFREIRGRRTGRYPMESRRRRKRSSRRLGTVISTPRLINTRVFHAHAQHFSTRSDPFLGGEPTYDKLPQRPIDMQPCARARGPNRRSGGDSSLRRSPAQSLANTH